MYPTDWGLNQQCMYPIMPGFCLRASAPGNAQGARKRTGQHPGNLVQGNEAPDQGKSPGDLRVTECRAEIVDSHRDFRVTATAGLGVESHTGKRRGLIHSR